MITVKNYRELICKLRWCKSNPFDFTDNNKIKSDLKVKVKENFQTIEKKDMYAEVFKKFARILCANGFEPTENAKETMELLGINPAELTNSEAVKWTKGTLLPIKTEESIESAKKKPAGKSKPKLKAKRQVEIDI